MKQKIISFIKKYLICFAIMGLATAGILLSAGYSADATAVVRYLNLADAFTVPAIVMILFGTLVWISTTGFFDSIGYIVAVGARALLPFLRNGKYEKYYDYKARKEEKRIKGYSFLFFSGVVYLIVGIIFVLLFYSVY